MVLPGRHSLFTKRNGPEPIGSGMRWSGGVAAMRAGIITGNGALGLPSTSSISGNGSFSANLNVRASVASSKPVSAISILPSGSRTDQRLSEATQSAAVTAVPSCHLRPSRNLKLQLSLSADASQLSTICGLISPCSFMANSMSKTCRPKVRVMVAVMTWGSRIVTSDSSTTIMDLAARASRGLISDAVASAAPPAIAVLRPNAPVRISYPHPGQMGSVAAIGRRPKEKQTSCPACFPLFESERALRREDAASHAVDEDVGTRPIGHESQPLSRPRRRHDDAALLHRATAVGEGAAELGVDVAAAV